MNEKELKEIVNSFRREIEKRNKKISHLYHELDVYKKEAEKSKIRRDNLNEEIKRKLEIAKRFTEKRNTLNEHVSKLKKKRASIILNMKSLGENIRTRKGERNRFNRIAKGNTESLNELYKKKMRILLDNDIPLEDEIKLFERIFEIKERIIASENAEKSHKDVISNYKKLKELETEMQKINDEIDSIAKESQGYHKNAIEIYEEVDRIRKEADKFHKILVEKYTRINIIRSKISDIKMEIYQFKKQMEPYDRELKMIRLERGERKKDRDAIKAKKKLQKKGRIDFDDLRILLERNELSLSKK